MTDSLKQNDKKKWGCTRCGEIYFENDHEVHVCPACIRQETEMYANDDKRRILALIELIQKKDEALKVAIESLDRVPKEIYEALALTADFK